MCKWPISVDTQTPFSDVNTIPVSTGKKNLVTSTTLDLPHVYTNISSYAQHLFSDTKNNCLYQQEKKNKNNQNYRIF